MEATLPAGSRHYGRAIVREIRRRERKQIVDLISAFGIIMVAYWFAIQFTGMFESARSMAALIK